VEHFMTIKYLMAAGFIAAMLALAGCGTDDTWDDDPATTDTWDDQTRTQPERAPAGTADGAEQTWQYDPETQQTEPAGQPQTGQAGQTGVTSPGTGTGMTGEQPRTGEAETGDVGMTEFSALDTDATGTLTEEQWVPEAVGGVEFDEVDQDGDGIVTREEFRAHFIDGQAGPGRGAQEGTTQ
jgi:hypothetical protein